MTDSLPDFVRAFDVIPFGTHKALYHDRTYVITKSALANDKAQKLVAEALDGSDYISLNLYRLTNGPLLKPCEMPASKVIAFVVGLTICLHR